MIRVVFWSLRKSKWSKKNTVRTLRDIPACRLFVLNSDLDDGVVYFFHEDRLWSTGLPGGRIASEPIDTEDSPDHQPGEFSECQSTENRNWLRGEIKRVRILPLIAVRKEVVV